MVRGETLTAVIPARGGSEGLPGKNLYKIDGETLVERTIRHARESGRVDQVFVTTDDPAIYAVAKKLNAAPPSLRPAHLATRDALTIDAVHHLITDAGISSGYIILLQVTSPLWTVEDLCGICRHYEEHPEADAIVSVVRHDAPHPDKIMKIDEGWLKSYLGRETMVPRQNLPPVYALNGAFYLTSLSVLGEKQTFIPERSIPFIMPPERSVNLDGPLDLLLARLILEKGLHKNFELTDLEKIK